MKHTALFWIALSLFSCAEKEKKFRMTPVFRPYDTEFIHLANQNGKLWHVDDLVMTFITKFENETEAGQCQSFDNGETPIIVISRTTWNELKECQRFNLVFHELGHCLLNRGHTNDLSFMRPSLLSESQCELNEDYLKQVSYALREFAYPDVYKGKGITLKNENLNLKKKS